MRREISTFKHPCHVSNMEIGVEMFINGGNRRDSSTNTDDSWRSELIVCRSKPKIVLFWLPMVAHLAGLKVHPADTGLVWDPRNSRMVKTDTFPWWKAFKVFQVHDLSSFVNKDHETARALSHRLNYRLWHPSHDDVIVRLVLVPHNIINHPQSKTDICSI